MGLLNLIPESLFLVTGFFIMYKFAKREFSHSLWSHLVIFALLAIYIFGEKKRCPPVCGHIHNGRDSIRLWKKDPLTRELIPWFKQHQNIFEEAGEKHDIFVMTFFAKLNDCICCVDHAVRAEKNNSIQKCEKDKAMSSMLANEAINVLRMFKKTRGLEIETTPVENVLEKLLQKIKCNVGETNPFSKM